MENRFHNHLKKSFRRALFAVIPVFFCFLILPQNVSATSHCADDASAMSVYQALPVMAPGSTADLILNLGNNGNTWWYNGGVYRMVQTSNTTYAAADLGIPYWVLPANQPAFRGEHQGANFTWPITAPATPGTYTLQFRMMHVAGWIYRIPDPGRFPPAQTLETCPGPSSNTYFGPPMTVTFTVDINAPPPPPPPSADPRFIYYIDPYAVLAGQKVVIVGQNLTTTVSFRNASGVSVQSTGTLSKDNSQVSAIVPSSLAPGYYNLSVGPNPDSNTVEIEVNTGTYDPGPTSGQTPIVLSLNPSVISQGGTLEIMGKYLTPVVQFINSAGAITETDGSVSQNYGTTTVSIPDSIPPGIYTVAIVSPYGTGQSSDFLTIIEGNTAIIPGISAQSIPSATPFQNIITNAFNYSLVVVGIAVFIMIMWGGFLWLTSAANPANLGVAKKYITNALLGAILLVSAYVILYTINPELVGGEFILTGIEAPPPTGSAGGNKFVATSEMSSAGAIIAGCAVDIDARDFTSLNCNPNNVAGLGLLPNPVISAVDSDVNNQIGATTIQNNGNLGAGRKVVVLDTGYNYNHPELSSSYLGGKDFINNDNDPMDDHAQGQGAPPGHGSHVAGIITGDGVNARARGVAPQAGIIAGKILDGSGVGNWDKMIQAIYWAVNGPDGVYGTGDDFRADVINLSVGGGLFSSTCDNDNELTRRLAQALQYARDNGVLPVIAAGNSSGGISMPGCIDAAFTVGAVDSSDGIANFSGRGGPVDIVAPGVNIYSSLLGNNYGTKQGTSQAAPVVSGVAAILKRANPGYTPAQLEQAITSSACDLGQTGKDTTFGWGRVSLTPGSCTPPPPQPPSSGPAGTVTISPSSCTKGTIAGNPNCNLNISYSITGITSATQLTVVKNNVLFQTIQCSSNPCNGQLTDINPSANNHTFNFRLPNNQIIASRTAYIYSTGNITATFNSCTVGGAANPNCDITLNIRATGIAPNSAVVTKDGTNWRTVICAVSPCNATLTDAGPAAGIHTYALYNSFANSRLGRATVTILRSGNPPPTPPPADEWLIANEYLYPGQSLNSTDGLHQLSLQTDGNLVLYRINGMVPLWTSGTVGTIPDFLVMASDGNLILYSRNTPAGPNFPSWQSGTSGNPGAALAMQNGGVLIIYTSVVGGTPIWIRP